MALARLYHDLDLDANHNFAGVLRCLETLSSRPHLSDQVYTFVLNWRPEEGRDVAPIEQLLFQVLNSIYPNAYAVCIRGGSISLDRLIYSQNCPKLQCLRLESSYSPIGSNIGSEFVANALVHLEAHIGFVTLVLHHLPRLLSLVVITTDKTRHPHETQKLYHLQHSTLRKLSVVMTWLLYVDPLWIRYLVDNTTPLEKMPNVDHFTFVLSVPPWGAVSGQTFAGSQSLMATIKLSDLLLGFFLPKLPSVKAIIIDSSLMRPLDLRKITRICPHLINVVLQNENKEWIKEQSRIRWRLFDRGALANALYGSQSMTTLDELRMAFTACVEHIIDIDSHVDSTSTGI